jgi:2-polyprenyl-3-methyl-5-hydroxy-6-metoxy-1,4-benzoquinol methylase
MIFGRARFMLFVVDRTEKTREIVQLPRFVSSPLTGDDAPLTLTIPSSRLVKAYRDNYGYDAERYFVDVPEVGLYRCSSGFGFYFPFSLAGDESLYRRLETFDWNYKENKWEHEAALPHIQRGQKVLDVGCGEGNFLAKVQGKGAIASGIELNRKAAKIAKDKGIHVHEELLQSHQLIDFYDVVTSFQVLEHVADPLAFVQGCIKVLRPGGTLVIGVPNDDSFLRLDPTNYLNQPPHHMGLWNRRSLSALAAVTDLEIKSFEIEPLAETGWYQAVMENRYLGPWQRRLFHRLGFADIFARYVRENASTIAGHTIMGVYCRPLAM